MLERVFVLCSGLSMTIAAGVFLLASLLLLLLAPAANIPIDPAWVTVVICGFPLFYLAITEIIHNKGIQKISSALLISIAMLASIIIGELFAAGEVAFIMAIGAILEDKTVEKAKQGIHQLLRLAPAEGLRKIVDGREVEVSIEQVQKGDTLRVLPGETIPVDGDIFAGHTSVDQSIMTGESLPVDKAVGDSVYCGTINRFGSIDIVATTVGKDSSLQKLIRMVQEAENNKAPMQRIVDQWAAWLVPIALLIALVTYFLTSDIIRTVTILVVFCPCALALATPTSIMAAIGQATKRGVLIKSGDALERMGKVDCIAFDKTGTLTHGKLTVSDLIPLGEDLSEDELLRLTASVEARSEHPIGKAIGLFAKQKEIELIETEGFQMNPGRGICAEIDGESYYCGSGAWLAENGISLNTQVEEALQRLQMQGKAAILLAKGQGCIGIIALSDTLRPSATAMLQELAATQTDALLLTGDHQQAADYFAAQLGITKWYAGLLPDEKVQKIQMLQNEGRRICMIGDGVNDAPALKTANVGVAMGNIGSDIAIEAADIALMGDDIAQIPYLKRLSNATVRLIKLNITLSMAINFMAIALSVMGVLNPITGALVHNVGSVLVVLNAASLYDRKFE